MFMLSPPFLSTHTIPTTMFVICVGILWLALDMDKKNIYDVGKGKNPTLCCGWNKLG